MSRSGAVVDAIRTLTPNAVSEINSFSKEVLATRGGRIGSGMGLLLEALWGYYINRELLGEGGAIANCEIAWLSDHEYNDFACVERDADWDPSSRQGEILRIEAKSMNTEADESKGHFDEPKKNLGGHDLLLILVWVWDKLDDYRVFPHILDAFIDLACPLADLRDALHMARGGSFVDREACPDKCTPQDCLHHGEPLNASGIRERVKGPISCKGGNVSFAANFGGLVRMLKQDRCSEPRGRIPRSPTSTSRLFTEISLEKKRLNTKPMNGGRCANTSD